MFKLKFAKTCSIELGS